MDRVSTKTLLTFAFLDAIYWGFGAASNGFLSSYLLSCGMSNSFLSIVLAIYMLCSFFGAFYWGGMCDKLKSNKKVFIPELLLTLLAALGIYFGAKSHVMIGAILFPLFGFCFMPLGSLLDAWMLKVFHQDAFLYGRARGTGSAGYAISALVVGQLINTFGYQMMPICFVGCAFITFVITILLKEEAYVVNKKVEKADPKQLFKIKPFIYLLVILFLTGLALSPYNNLKIVILQSVGGDVGMLGIDSFVGVMVQAVFIFISGSLRRFPQYVRLLIMTICIAITMVLCVLASNPYMIILGTVFVNISYGFMLPTAREMTEMNITGSLKNTAHSLADAMFGSFAGVIALLYSGTLMDVFGVKFVAMIGLGIMLVPVGMSMYGMMQEKKVKG